MTKPKIHKDLLEYWKDMAREAGYNKFAVIDADHGVAFPYEFMLIADDEYANDIKSEIELEIYDTIYVGEA